MISKLSLFLLSLQLISCIEVRDPDKKAEVTEVQTQPEVQIQSVPPPVVEVRALPQPHKYAVLIKGIADRSRVFRKVVGNLKFGESIQLSVQNAEAEDIIEQAGHYEYSVQQIDRDIPLQVVIPQDYVIHGDKSLQQLEKDFKRRGDSRVLEIDGRVFFKAGAALTTMGENLLIKAQIIESEGARIQTFPLNQTSELGADGNHGGHIKIEASLLRGTLHVVMRGADAGPAESSSPFGGKSFEQKNTKGHKGGNTGLLETQIQDQSLGDITFELHPGKGTVGVPLMTGCFNLSPNPPPCSPSVYKEKGPDGFNGVAQQPVGIK